MLNSLFSKLRRVTSRQSYLPTVDGVRFIAIMGVVVQHLHERILRRTQEWYPDISEEMLAFGGPGFLLFFSLSGYILHRGLRGARERSGTLQLRAYFLRRVTRIEPPYVIVITALFVFLYATEYKPPYARRFYGAPESLFESWLASIAYAHCVLYGNVSRILGVAWTLETEVQFYLVAPALAWLAWCLRALARPRLFIGLGCLWALTVSPVCRDNQQLRRSLMVYLPYFVIGMGVEELGRLCSRIASHRHVNDFIGVISLLGLFILAHFSELPFQDFWQSALAGGALWGCMEGMRLRTALSHQGVTVVGGMCYSIYLLHMPILELMASHTSVIGRGLPYFWFLCVQMLTLIPMVILGSGLLFVAIERPCMDPEWPRKLARLLGIWKSRDLP